MRFRDIVARHETRLVRAACWSEGFDAGLIEAVIAQRLANPSRVGLAERSWDRVAKYVPTRARDRGGRRLVGMPNTCDRQGSTESKADVF